MATKRIEWDAAGKRDYEMGVDQGVLYPATDTDDVTSTGAVPGYGPGVPWNGLVSVSETPEGAEPTDLYADNIKYGTLMSAETLGLSIEHYSTPAEFYPCDGILIKNGAMITGQPRTSFGFTFRTKTGNDQNPDAGYKLHIVYGCTAGVAERAYNTINDSPEVLTFSRTITTLPVKYVDGDKTITTAEIIIDSSNFKTPELKAKLKALEDALYGVTASTDPVVAAAEPYLPTPEQVMALLAVTGD